MIFATDRTKTKFQNSKVVFSCFSSASCSCATWQKLANYMRWQLMQTKGIWMMEPWNLKSAKDITPFSPFYMTPLMKNVSDKWQDVTSDLLILVEVSSPPSGTVITCQCRVFKCLQSASSACCWLSWMQTGPSRNTRYWKKAYGQIL